MLDYEFKRTILNDIEEAEGLLKLNLSSGEIIYGKSDVILFESVDDEDDDCFEETEYIRSLPNGIEPARYLTEDEIKSYEIVE